MLYLLLKGLLPESWPASFETSFAPLGFPGDSQGDSPGDSPGCCLEYFLGYPPVLAFVFQLVYLNMKYTYKYLMAESDSEN